MSIGLAETLMALTVLVSVVPRDERLAASRVRLLLICLAHTALPKSISPNSRTIKTSPPKNKFHQRLAALCLVSGGFHKSHSLTCLTLGERLVLEGRLDCERVFAIGEQLGN